LDTLAGHTATVRSAAFGPDGRTIATVSEDGSARLWDLSEPGGRHQVRLLDVHGGLVVSVAFSPDGRTLATGSDDDTAVLWKMPSAWPDHIDMAQAARQACEIIENPISQAEWARYLPGVAYRPPCLNGG